MTRTNQLALTALLVLTVVSSSGCVYSREISQTRRDIEHANPDLRLDRQITASVGPIGVRFARWITSRVDDVDARRASKYLRDIKRVKVGVYDVRGGSEGLVGVSEMRRFRRPGWELAARVRDDDEDTWVYYRERNGRISDLYAIVYSDDELVIARVSGRLTRLVEEAMADHLENGGLADWEFWNE